MDLVYNEIESGFLSIETRNFLSELLEIPVEMFISKEESENLLSRIKSSVFIENSIYEYTREYCHRENVRKVLMLLGDRVVVSENAFKVYGQISKEIFENFVYGNSHFFNYKIIYEQETEAGEAGEDSVSCSNSINAMAE